MTQKDAAVGGATQGANPSEVEVVGGELTGRRRCCLSVAGSPAALAAGQRRWAALACPRTPPLGWLPPPHAGAAQPAHSRQSVDASKIRALSDELNSNRLQLLMLLSPRQ